MKVYIVAEVGSTHDGSLGNAVRMVDTFAGLGADAIKLQCHHGQMVGGKHPSPNVWEERAEYYERTGFSLWEWRLIASECRDRGKQFIVSPFSVAAVERMYGMVDAWKIASGEVTNLELLEAVKETGLPVYLSSGMSTLAELDEAARLLGGVLNCVMHCTSEYPCAPERVGLNVVREWKADLETYSNVCTRKGWASYRLGLSDHTMGLAASLAAITLGATVIERHVTFDRRMYGSDAAHSLEPEEFGQFVREVRELEKMLANPVDKDELVKSPAIQAAREVFLCTNSAQK